MNEYIFTYETYDYREFCFVTKNVLVFAMSYTDALQNASNVSGVCEDELEFIGIIH